MTSKKNRTQGSTGKEMKKIRTAKKITLNQMANETGFSIDVIKKFESGEKHPSVGELLQISKALEIDSSFLLLNQASSTERAKVFIERTEDYAYTTLTPKAENKHLRAFRVSIEAMQEHKGISYQHEGEEFIYVLKGHIEVTVGDHVNSLGWGESLHFNSAINHKLKNVGSADAELLVVIYTP